MKILLTNDDGIDSAGIQRLAEILRSRGHKVYVIAPDINRSGISHAVSLLANPVKLSEHGEDSWACSGYPADCVIAGIMGALNDKPDAVLSGINKGANLGTDLIYSGTAAAARQASLAGIPAVALSLAGDDCYYWNMAALWSADHLEELLAYWENDTFLNVNIPNNPHGPGGIAETIPAKKNYNDSLSVMTAPDGNRWCFLAAGQETVTHETNNDWNTVARNFVSISRVYSYACVRPFYPAAAVRRD